MTIAVPWCLVRIHYTAKEKTESSQHTVRAHTVLQFCSTRLATLLHQTRRQSFLHQTKPTSSVNEGHISPRQLRRCIASITSRVEAPSDSASPIRMESYNPRPPTLHQIVKGALDQEGRNSLLSLRRHASSSDHQAGPAWRLTTVQQLPHHREVGM